MIHSTFIKYDNSYVDYKACLEARNQFPLLNQILVFSSALNSEQITDVSFPCIPMNYQDTFKHLKKIATTYQTLETKLKEIRSDLSNSDQQLAFNLVKAYANILQPKPFSVFKRTYPLFDKESDIIYFDWQYCELLNSKEQELFRQYLFSHPDCKYCNRLFNHRVSEMHLFYKDNQIVKVHSLITRSTEKNIFYKGMTDTKKHVFQQFGLKNGFTTCIHMLLADYSSDYLESCLALEVLKITNYDWKINHLNEDVKQHIKANKLQAITTRVSSFEQLEKALEKHGSACIQVYSDDFHAIIVDEVVEEGVRIRDSFHGWSITITKEAFLITSKLIKSPLDLIQFAKKE